ncbi:MAG TPA: DUF4340 domain-containing protein, partial [Candidatus Angelobacter sp.]|nr:DUF4340 domain-containing protein [Candidatus Angelobacter sp.]
FLALLILAALTGALYWSNHSSSAKTPEPASTPSPKILALSQDDILKLEIKKKGGDGVSLAKESSGNWRITAPKELGADSNAVSSMVSALSPLTADRVIEEKAGDLQPYGLAQPAVELVVTTKNNQSQRLLIGDDTPSHNGTYAAVAGQPQVFTIAGFTKSSLDKGLNDLRDKRLLTVEAGKIKKLDLTTKSSHIVFQRNENRWQITKPAPSRAEQSQVDELVRKLLDAKIDFAGGDEDASKISSSFAKGAITGNVKVISDAGTQEIELRKVGDDYYAKPSVTGAPYKVSSDVAQIFSKNPEEFRNKKLFDLGFTDPAKIEFHNGTKSYFLTRSGVEWWGPAGKKMELSGASSFIDHVRDLQAAKFVDSGFGAPTIEITVTPEGGGHAEKVLLAKSGENYIAKRDGEPQLYQVDSKVVQELQNSAEQMKSQDQGSSSKH